jgi:hypothetical protein
MAVSDFKEVNERIMARTLLYLSYHNSGTVDET